MEAPSLSSRQLQYFCRVVEMESISKAAVSLGVNQSALSRHMQNLEASFGEALFHRNGHGVTLTAFGQQFSIRAARMLEEVELARQDAVNARETAPGRLVVGMTPDLARVLAAPLAEKLLAAFADTSLCIIEGHSGDLMERLDSGQMDVAILYDSWAARRRNAELLTNEALCLVAPPAWPPLPACLPLSDLTRFALILPGQRHELRRLLDRVTAEHKVPIEVAMEADGFNATLALLHGGLGYTILPVCCIQEDVALDRLQASMLTEPLVTCGIVSVMPISRRPSRSCYSRIVRILRDSVRRLPEVARRPLEHADA